MSKLHFGWFVALLVGCGQYPNPNDLTAIKPENRAEIANKRLEAAEATLQYKVEHNEITDDRRNQLIRELADEMLTKVDPKVIPDSDQWMYGALLRVTNRWAEAEAALKIAVKVAPDPDRKINDSLKLAQAQAKNKEVAEAIETASSVLTADDVDVAPILVSVLYEIVPAAEGQGHDKELAELLGKAIDCQQRAKVDGNTDEGRAFKIASHYHITKALEMISKLNGSKV
jgi:tetratricopeptide (TPR) repeat protein